MSRLFEELDYQQTQLGELILRRRRILKLDRDVVEVILNDEHLMSDMFTASEIALATIPMGRFSTPEDLANAALYLCSDEASLVTGVCMEIDGGRCI